jgi:hypothetical protein
VRPITPCFAAVYWGFVAVWLIDFISYPYRIRSEEIETIPAPFECSIKWCGLLGVDEDVGFDEFGTGERRWDAGAEWVG